MGEPADVPPAAVPALSAGDRRLFPWLAWGLSFALLLSDYMGALSSVVAVTVGVLTVPLSILADRFGRRRAILSMVVVWSLATLGSALAADYGQLLTDSACPRPCGWHHRLPRRARRSRRRPPFPSGEPSTPRCSVVTSAVPGLRCQRACRGSPPWTVIA